MTAIKPRKFTECPHCKKMFQPRNPRAWYCSDECRDDSRRKRDKEQRAKAASIATARDIALAERAKQAQKTALKNEVLRSKTDVDAAMRRIGL